MSKRIKELTEKRGAKLEEARAIVESAQKENRELNVEELNKVEGIHAEAELLTRNLSVEARQIAEEARKINTANASTPEAKRFSLAKFLRQIDPSNKSDALDGVELEIAQEGERESREANLGNKGYMVPQWVFERRDMTATGGTSLNQGGMTIETEKFGLLDDLFNRSVLGRAGATFLPNLVGNIDMPRLVKGTAPAGKAENAQATEYTATTTQVSLSPKRLPTVIEISKQLMMQSNSRPFETYITRHLESFINQQMQVKALHGGGTTEPTGLASVSGIGSVAGGTNGAAPDYADIVNLIKEVAVDDADVGNEYFIINPQVEAKLKQVLKVASTDSLTVIDARNGQTLDSKPYLVTNSVSSTLTKGTSTSVCSAIFYGAWRDLWIASWGGIEFLVNPYSKDDYGLTRINAAVYYDSAPIRPVSFSAMLDALTA